MQILNLSLQFRVNILYTKIYIELIFYMLMEKLKIICRLWTHHRSRATKLDKSYFILLFRPDLAE